MSSSLKPIGANWLIRIVGSDFFRYETSASIAKV